MTIQSLSIAVPAGCPNKCGFCVAHMHREEYENQIEDNFAFRDLYDRDYTRRLAFARDNGCNTLMFTGNGEALMNRNFMDRVATMNRQLERPFRSVELQTAGVTAKGTITEEYLRWLRNSIDVTTISLSLSSIFDSAKNLEYNGTPEKFHFDIDHLCSEIKRYNFNLRLSLNMTDVYNAYIDTWGVSGGVGAIFARAKALGANQVTFRQLYKSSANPESPENKWIGAHGADPQIFNELNTYIQEHGHKLERLPFGAYRYSLDEMSVVVDDDCMSTAIKDELKYLVLRPDCKLYTKWDDRGSILF